MVMEEMKLEGIDVLTLEGRFDAHTVPAADKWLEEVTSKLPPQVVVNMEDVNFVDSAGLFPFMVSRFSMLVLFHFLIPPKKCLAAIVNLDPWSLFLPS